MTVGYLRKLLEEHEDDAIVQINIEDGYNVTTVDEPYRDEDYNKSEAFVLVASLHDDFTVEKAV